MAKTLGRPQEDYKLSRYACYLVAMNGDPRKPEIASAQAYFVIKTREAETIGLAQSDRIRELQIQNENLRLEADIWRAKKSLIDAETAQLNFRHTVVCTCPEPMQQKILGYTTIDRIEYRDRIISGNDLIKDGSTISKTELCRRYSMTTKSGAPDYKKLNCYLSALPDNAWKSTKAIRENEELKREFLECLDSEVYGDNRQLFIVEQN